MTLFFFSVLADCALHGDIVLCTSYWGHLRVTWWLNFPQVLQCFCTLEHRRWDKTSLHFWGSVTGFRMTSVGFCSKTHKRKRLSQHRKRIESAFTETKLESGDEQRSIPFFFLDSILCRLLELMLAQLATSPQLFFFYATFTWSEWRVVSQRSPSCKSSTVAV